MYPCLSWNPVEIYYNDMSSILFIPTVICHIGFWIQVCLNKTTRHRALLWIYNYLILDIVSIAQIVLEHITRRIMICGVNPIWYDLLCVLEAYANTYTTMVQAFALILMNVYRYGLIVKNRNILTHSRRRLVSIHLLIYLLPLIILVMQYFLSASRIVDNSGSSCDIEFTSFISQFINLFFLIILPTCINIPIVIMIIAHVRSSQHAVRSVRQIHRRLIIQFIVLYTLWSLFFLPQVIFLISITSSASQRFITRILDIAAILSDVLIITLLDRRFIIAWKTSLRGILGFLQRNNRRITPLINPPIKMARVNQPL